MKTSFGTLTPFYFWKKEPFTQWTTSPAQFKHSVSTSYYGNKVGKSETIIEFNSTEQWMMWNKARMFGEYSMAQKILDTSNPREVKALGRKIKNFDQEKWDKVKLKIVYAGNYLKFYQNPEWRSLLEQVILDGQYFVEASPFDKIWGIGISPDEAKAGKEWDGENLLGIALTNVAIDLIKEGQKNMFQEDVNYASVPVVEALQKYLSEFINVNSWPNIDLLENDFDELVTKFVEDNFGNCMYRHHH